MKAILSETFLVVQVALCWIIFLPIAAIFFFGYSLRERVIALIRREPLSATETDMAGIGVPTPLADT